MHKVSSRFRGVQALNTKHQPFYLTLKRKDGVTARRIVNSPAQSVVNLEAIGATNALLG